MAGTGKEIIHEFISDPYLSLTPFIRELPSFLQLNSIKNLIV